MQELLLQVEQTGLTRAEIDEKIKQKQRDFHSLLTEEAALRLIAREKGVKIERRQRAEKPLQGAKAGDVVSALARIIYIGEPHKFTRENGEGVMTSVGLRYGYEPQSGSNPDYQGEATLILWNKDCREFLASGAKKNDVVAIRDALVKNLNPLELHATLVTKIEPPNKEEAKTAEKISTAAVNLIQLTHLSTPLENCDVNCTVAKIGAAKTFNSNGREGKICKIEVMQGKAIATLVCWGSYAEIAEKLNPGSKITCQNLCARLNKLSHQLELHTTDTSRIIATSTGKVEKKQKKELQALVDGDMAMVEIMLKKLLEVKHLTMCSSCRASARHGMEKCEKCGGKTEETIVAEALIADPAQQGKTEMRCSFYDSRALHLLGMKSIAPDIAATIAKLKAPEIEGQMYLLNITVKQNHFLNALSATCREFC